jgi:hypothetical protein
MHVFWCDVSFIVVYLKDHFNVHVSVGCTGTKGHFNVHVNVGCTGTKGHFNVHVNVGCTGTKLRTG